MSWKSVGAATAATWPVIWFAARSVHVVLAVEVLAVAARWGRRVREPVGAERLDVEGGGARRSALVPDRRGRGRRGSMANDVLVADPMFAVTYQPGVVRLHPGGAWRSPSGSRAEGSGSGCGPTARSRRSLRAPQPGPPRAHGVRLRRARLGGGRRDQAHPCRRRRPTPRSSPCSSPRRTAGCSRSSPVRKPGTKRKGRD